MEKKKTEKFKHLTSQYKNYLSKVDKILVNLKNDEEKFSELNKLYTKINELNTKSLILEKDIDDLFYNYTGNNETVPKMKQLLKKRNKIIISNLLNSNQYKEYVKKLQTEYKVSLSRIEKALQMMIKKYSMTWKCCWSFVDIADDGKIKKIELFDIDDIEYFKKKIRVI
jgi:hypothetical protein